ILIPVINVAMGSVKGSPWARGFLDGVNVAALGLMAGVSYQLARAAILDPITAIIFAAAAVCVFRWKVNAAWLVAGGGAIGLLHMAAPSLLR
ncbi:MAG: chromate transporter, partial [Chloroflexota bacterium]